MTPGAKRTVLVAATMGSFLAPFMTTSVNVALPAIGTEFDAGAHLLSWIAMTFLLASAVFLVPLGRLADLKGRRRVFTSGLLLFALASAACGLTPSVWLLLVFRILQGVGGAMMFGTGVAMVSSAYPVSERGGAIGVTVGAAYIGMSFGPAAGGLVTFYAGWRALFFLNAVLSAAVFFLVRGKIKTEWAEAKGEPFDFPGALSYGLALLLFMYGLSLLPGGTGFLLSASGLLLGLGFVLWELKTPYPVFAVSLFKGNRTFLFSNAAAFINYSATFGVGFLLSLYLQYVKDLPSREAGAVLMAQPVMQALFSPLAGRLSDRLGARLLATSGMACTAGGLFLLVFVDAATGLPYIAFSLAFLGFGFALFSSPNTTAIMSSVEKRSYGLASASVGTMRLTGQMFSLGLVQLLFSLLMGSGKIGPDLVPGFLAALKAAFGIFTVLCVLGIGASLARGRPAFGAAGGKA